MALANDTFVSAAATASSFLKQFLNHEVTFRYGERNISVQYAYTIAVAVGVVSLSKLYSSVVSSSDQGIPHKAGYPIVGSWAFFTQRHNFVDEGIKKFGNIFSFKILNHEVLAVHGEDARKVFFGTKNLGFQEGYDVLFGGAPQPKEIDVKRDDESTGRVEWFTKRISNVLQRERLRTMLPLMLDDLDRAMKKWGTAGKFDPFEDIYAMVFQLTIRAASCKEVADDPEAVKKVTKLYWDAEKGSTPTSVLLPWFPSAARKRKLKATQDLFMLFKQHVDDRKATGRVEEDPMQSLIDAGDGANDIVVFVMGALFAGIINTGIMSSWLVLYFAENAEWKEKALNEIRSFVTQYSSKEEGQSLAQQLSQIPPQVWEDEMPVLDQCLRETIRRSITGTTLRRVMQDGDEDPSLVIEGKKLKKGQFLAYHIGGTHHDPEIYSNPNNWDPSRFDRGEDKKQHWAFLGWGAGRHPCTGMRFAKLEVKLILSLILTQYEYDVVNGAGNVVTKIPEPSRDNLYQVPPVETVYVRYKHV